MKNHVDIYFIVLCNQVLSHHKLENHVKINLFHGDLQRSFELPLSGKSGRKLFHNALEPNFELP